MTFLGWLPFALADQFCCRCHKKRPLDALQLHDTVPFGMECKEGCE